MDPKIQVALKKHEFQKAKFLLNKTHQNSLLALTIKENELEILKPLLDYCLQTMSKELLEDELRHVSFLAISLRNIEAIKILFEFSFCHQHLDFVLKYQISGQSLLSYAASRSSQIVYEILSWSTKNHLIGIPTFLTATDNQQPLLALLNAIQYNASKSALYILRYMEKFKLNITLRDSTGHCAFILAVQHCNGPLSRELIRAIRKNYSKQELIMLITRPCNKGETILEKAFNIGDQEGFFLYLHEVLRLNIPFMHVVPNLYSALSIAIYLSQKERPLYCNLMKKEFYEKLGKHFHCLMQEGIHHKDYEWIKWLLNFAKDERLTSNNFSFLKFAYDTPDKRIIELLLSAIASSENEKVRNQLFFKALLETSLKGMVIPVKIILDYLKERDFLKQILEQHQDQPCFLKVKDFLKEHEGYFFFEGEENEILRENTLAEEYSHSILIDTKVRAWIDSLPKDKVSCEELKLSFFESNNPSKSKEPLKHIGPALIHRSNTY